MNRFQTLQFQLAPLHNGLLTATFGNVTELVIAIVALHNGQLRVVQLSLLVGRCSLTP
jgi:calcium/proton exchanger cax